MLEFKLSFTKNHIKPEEKTAVTFELNNLSDKTIHCLSYKFVAMKDGMVVEDFRPHKFLFDIPANETKQRVFGEVNASESYLGSNTNEGEYTVQVTIEYFVCGLDKVDKAVSQAIIRLAP